MIDDSGLVPWFELAILSSYAFSSRETDAAIEEFLLRQGRGRYVRPIYRGLFATAEGRARAKQIYDVARPRYHAVSRGAVDRIFAGS